MKAITLTNLVFLVSLSVSAQWTSISSGTTVNLQQILFTDSLNGYILGDSVVLKTSDGGNTWNQIFNNHRFFGFDFLNPSTGAILGNDTVFKTSDSGITWSEVIVSTPLYFQGSPLFYMTTAAEWFYVRGQRHAHTTDGGITWNEMSMGNSGPIPIVPTDMQKVNNTFFGIGWYGPVIFKSADNGWTWNGVAGINSNYLTSLTFPSAHIAYASGNRGIFKSTDGGISWQLNDTTILWPGNGPSDPTIECIRHLDSNIIYAVGNRGTILSTKDGGNSWQTELSGTTNNLNKLVVSYGRAIAIGDSGTILLNNDNSISTSIEDHVVDRNDHVLIYPNPAFNFFNVEIKSKIDKKVLFTLYGPLGESVMEKYYFNADFTVDMEHTKKGVFFYRIIISNSDQYAGKIVKY